MNYSPPVVLGRDLSGIKVILSLSAFWILGWFWYKNKCLSCTVTVSVSYTRIGSPSHMQSFYHCSCAGTGISLLWKSSHSGKKKFIANQSQKPDLQHFPGEGNLKKKIMLEEPKQNFKKFPVPPSQASWLCGSLPSELGRLGVWELGLSGLLGSSPAHPNWTGLA